MTTDREERIRERAHRIWRARGGRTTGRSVHWEIAARIIDEEDSAAAAPADEAAIDDAVEQTFPPATRR